MGFNFSGLSATVEITSSSTLPQPSASQTPFALGGALINGAVDVFTVAGGKIRYVTDVIVNKVGAAGSITFNLDVDGANLGNINVPFQVPVIMHFNTPLKVLATKKFTIDANDAAGQYTALGYEVDA